MKFLLRQLKPADASALHRLMEENRPRLIKYFPLTVAKTRNLEQTTGFLKRTGEGDLVDVA